MTIKDVLEKRLEMLNHNLLCYSKNYLLEPKDNYQKEHAEILEEIKVIEDHLKTL
jgi:hypothetical protein